MEPIKSVVALVKKTFLLRNLRSYIEYIGGYFWKRESAKTNRTNR